MAKQTRVNITKIPEGQLFKWNRVIYRKVGKTQAITQAINTRTGKETIFSDRCTVILVSDEETSYDATDKRYTLTIVFDPKMENVLMVTHHKQGMLNYVGGHIEPGEDEMDASYRELYEETGITRDDTDLKFVQSEHCFASFANPEWYLYVTAGVLKHDVELKEEKNKLQWVSLQNMDAFLYQSFGDGNCYMFLRRALEVLYINNNLEDQAYEDRD